MVKYNLFNILVKLITTADFKYFYDSIALILGRLPVVYVEAGLEQLGGRYVLPIKLAKLWIFSVRAIMTFVLFWMLGRICKVLIQGHQKLLKRYWA